MKISIAYGELSGAEHLAARYALRHRHRITAATGQARTYGLVQGEGARR